MTILLIPSISEVRLRNFQTLNKDNTFRTILTNSESKLKADCIDPTKSFLKKFTKYFNMLIDRIIIFLI